MIYKRLWQVTTYDNQVWFDGNGFLIISNPAHTKSDLSSNSKLVNKKTMYRLLDSLEAINVKQAIILRYTWVFNWCGIAEFKCDLGEIK